MEGGGLRFYKFNKKKVVKGRGRGLGGCMEFQVEIDCFATRGKGKQKRKVYKEWKLALQTEGQTNTWYFICDLNLWFCCEVSSVENKAFIILNQIVR